ncbi:MAG: acetoacetyl-[acyl-carrier protein] synthase [Cryomorphaceae bacterium]|jgi:acetoacetyl-[acyl-carrier protein] synthase
MNRLPVIVGFGGYNAAGRSSFHHGYRRTVLNSLNQPKRVSTLLSLAVLMQLVEYKGDHYEDKQGTKLTPLEVADKYQSTIEQNTLIRKIHAEHFDPDHVPQTRDVELNSEQSSSFSLARRDLPKPVPSNWQVETIDDKTVRVEISGNLSVKMLSFREMEVKAAGILPTGFIPADQYTSRFHPKGLQMTVVGASDAINSLGIPWEKIMSKVHPDEVAVFAASALGQADEYGIGGYMQARLRSNRPSSKQMALGLNSMPADFINAYMCGSVGTTGAVAGACATFLYNLRLAVDDIASGRHRVVICGSSEAPVTPEVMEGFAAMSALGTDKNLARLDGLEEADHSRACRPFGENVGFTMGESTQFFILMDDQLALELGADIYGAVPNVFVNADGFKKSISSPGAGNYITLAKAVGAAKAIVGEESIRQRSFIQAHGSSTPQNRITESIIFDKVARGFGIESWPVTAVKAFVGHPLGPASGDQLANTLGTFADGIIPGIKTTEAVASDVLDEKLDILLQDKQALMDVAFLNSKGFGGNNATATVLSPQIVEQMMVGRYGADAFAEYEGMREHVRAQAKAYDESAMRGELNIIYNFGVGIIDDADITISDTTLSFENFEHDVHLEFENKYADMTNG